MRDMTRLIRQAQGAGLCYQHGKKHGRIVDPRTGRFVTVASTPSCANAFKNARADVRRYLRVAL